MDSARGERRLSVDPAELGGGAGSSGAKSPGVRLLVLGGTAFVGRHLVEAAIDRGHTVTLFTRGLTNAGIFPELEHVSGDRESDLAALAGRDFDAVLDTSGYVPRVVRSSAELLADHVERYVFVSSISVYEDAATVDELTPTQRADDPESEDVAAAYGPLKALCEQAVESALPGRVLVIRPGLVVGRYDYTGRFGYWPRRVAAGGEVLHAPAGPDARLAARRSRSRRVDDPDGRGAASRVPSTPPVPGRRSR